jgi:peroxiredoxin
MSNLKIGDRAPEINAIDQNEKSINLERKKSSAIFLP